MTSIDDTIARAATLILESKRIVAFSGAGISTEAGIPDFRSEGGLWENSDLMELMSAPGFIRDPEGFYRASIQLMPNIAKAEPTAAHKLVAHLEAQGRLTAVITQNIDGLHQAAGSQTVYEIHGNFRTGHCINCRTSYQMAEFYDRLERGELKLPLCSKCRLPIKPDAVLFGDLLPSDVWAGAVEAVTSCDLLLTLGSSLVVYPAAELPRTALDCGAKLIIVNREDTDYDPLADFAVHCELGDFARGVMEYGLSE